MRLSFLKFQSKLSSLFGFCCLGLFVLQLQGCATVRPAERVEEMQLVKELEDPAALYVWSTQGKVAFRKGKEGGHANFSWDQDHDHYLIRLSGPLSSGGVVIDGRPGHVELKDSEGRVWVAETPEALMEQRLGWRMPIEGMKYWIKGVTEPNVSKKPHLNQAKALVSLQQRGWMIQYQNYLRAKNYRLPQKMALSNDLLSLKVVIRQWRFP